MIPLDQLPPDVKNHVKDFLPSSELIQARRIVDDDKACYVVTVRHQEETVGLYVRPDGTGIIRKTEAVSLANWPARLSGRALSLILPGVIAGAFTRWLLRSSNGRTVSVRAAWLSAWPGATVGIGMLLFSLQTLRRDKDTIDIVAESIIGGALSASILELLVLILQSVRGSRAAHRRSILGCCITAGISLSILVPVEILRIDRENQRSKKLMMRTPLN